VLTCECIFRTKSNLEYASCNKRGNGIDARISPPHITVIVCISERITETSGKLAQTQSTHISVLLFVLPTVIRYSSRQLFYYTTHTLDWISYEIYTRKLTLHEDERRTLRQLCKLFCRTWGELIRAAAVALSLEGHPSGGQSSLG